MADKKVNLIISLKDGVSAGLGRIKSGVEMVGSAFKKLAIASVAMTTTIIAGFAGLAKAWAGQEAANARLSASFQAVGEDGAEALKRFSAFASEIQKITTVGDEATMSLVALGRTMGIATENIEEATKGAIGLSKAFGIDLNTAMKMTALAYQGEYEMLGRYIPALRTATSEAEKAAIVQEAMANGFSIAQAEMGTISGQFSALKNTIGDAMEAAGEAIFGDGGLTGALSRLREMITGMIEDGTIAKWAAQAKEALHELRTLGGKIKGEHE